MVLGDGQSSRLYQKLVKEEEMCQSIYVGTDDLRGPDLFSVWAIMAAEQNPADAQAVVFEELAAIASEGITERELEKVRNRIRSAFLFGLQSNMSRARNLAEFELYWGSAELLREELDRYLEVDAAAIQRVAGEYFAATNRTVLDVIPASASEDSEEAQ